MMGQMQSAAPDATLLVRGASQLLTLRGPAGPRRGAGLAELGIIPDGAVLIRDGRILEAGASRRLENLTLARGAREIDAAGRVVMPGLVDSRTRPLSTQAVAHRRLEARAQPVLDGMVRHGTTTVAASVGEELDLSSVIAMLRLLNSFDTECIDVVPDYCAAGPGDGNAICTEILPVLARRKLASLVSVNGRAFSAGVSRRILEQAQALGFRSTVDAGGSAAAVNLAIEMQAAAIVLDRVVPEIIPRLSRSQSIFTLLPASHQKNSEPPSARALVDAGAAVALASGFGMDDGPTYNMQVVISLACLEMGLTPAEAISAATINGAHALGRGHLCGSLEPSKAADLLLLNVLDYRDASAQFGVNQVHMVLRNGNIIYQEGEITRWTGQ